MSGIEIALAASAALGAVSSIQQGMAASSAASYNASVAANNAKQAQASAAYDEQRQREQNLRLMGSQRAAYAAAGIDPNSGSALDVGSDTAVQQEMDALAIRYGGKMQSNAAISEGNLARRQGRQAMTSGIMGAGSSLLTGYGNYEVAQSRGLIPR